MRVLIHLLIRALIRALSGAAPLPAYHARHARSRPSLDVMRLWQACYVGDRSRLHDARTRDLA
jgi:hypothetical protein